MGSLLDGTGAPGKRNRQIGIIFTAPAKGGCYEGEREGKR